MSCKLLSHRHGRTKVVAFLQGRGARHGTKSTADLSTQLCNAAAAGDIDALRVLIAAGGIDVNQGDYDNRTALHLASSEGLLPAVRFLVEEADAWLMPTDRWGGTPLDDATRHGRDKVVRYLQSRGAKHGARSNAEFSTQLCNAAASGDIDSLRVLIARGGFDVNTGDYVST